MMYDLWSLFIFQGVVQVHALQDESLAKILY